MFLYTKDIVQLLTWNVHLQLNKTKRTERELARKKLKRFQILKVKNWMKSQQNRDLQSYRLNPTASEKGPMILSSLSLTSKTKIILSWQITLNNEFQQETPSNFS